MDHYEKPRNVGSFDKSDPSVGTGLVGAPACGDVMKLQVRRGGRAWVPASWIVPLQQGWGVRAAAPWVCCDARAQAGTLCCALAAPGCPPALRLLAGRAHSPRACSAPTRPLLPPAPASAQIKVDEKGNIVDSCFKTFGCGSAIASSSVATEW